MDRYEAMQVFVSVAELQSFTQAAEQLGLPKATVTTSVQDLEHWTGTKLLNRTTRRVHLTPDGSSFLERCKDILSDLEETESMFKTDSAQITGKLRIDMTVSLARDRLIPLLPQFLEKYPGLEIELSGTDRRVDLLREGIDCVLRGGGPSEPGLVEKELGSMVVVNVASPAYVQKYGRPKSIEDLKNHKLVYYSQVLGAKPGGFEYFDGEKYREARMPGVITVNNVDTYKAACLAGLGICQNPLSGVAKDLASGALVELLPNFRAEPMKLKLVYPQRRVISKKLRAFIDWVEPIIQSYVQAS